MIRLINLAAAAVIAMVGAAWALDIAVPANTVIDQAQPTVTDWIGTTVASAVMVFAAWIGRTIGIKVVEYFNRDAIATAARNFADSVIDELQRRYLAAEGAQPDLADLVRRGADYVTSGSRDAVRESGISDDRVRAIVAGAMRARVGM